RAAEERCLGRAVEGCEAPGSGEPRDLALAARFAPGAPHLRLARHLRIAGAALRDRPGRHRVGARCADGLGAAARRPGQAARIGEASGGTILRRCGGSRESRSAAQALKRGARGLDGLPSFLGGALGCFGASLELAQVALGLELLSRALALFASLLLGAALGIA